GVASAQGSQETKTIKNGRSQALPTPTACMVRRVWLASNNAPAHQMAAIQFQPVERASARASIMDQHTTPDWWRRTGFATNGCFAAASGLKSLRLSPIQSRAAR